MSSRPLSHYRNTPLWLALEAAVLELSNSREITVNTAPDYVVEHLCRELLAKKLVVPGNVG